MQKAANLVRGWAELEVTGVSPEEFFNRCARQGVGFWGARQLEATRWVCRVALWDWRRAREAGERSRCEVKLLRRGGLPGFLWGLRYRYGLLVGLAVSVTAVAVLSQFVLTVRLEGNRKVPSGEILSQLRSCGVRPGAFGPGLDTRQIAHQVILEIPELSWMTINLHGTVAEVLVREGEPRPELVEEDAPAHIVARYTGIITHLDATRGMALVEEGDTVVAGDTLISSWVDFVEPPGYNGDMGGILVRATGRVEARVWHTLEAAVPLQGEAKTLTGRERSRWSLEVMGRTVNFLPGGRIPYKKYDKIVEYHTPHLPGGRALPLSLRRERCREYTTEPRAVNEAAAEALLRAELNQRLQTLVGEGEVLKTDYRAQRRDGLLTLTLVAECRQEIGKTVED